MILVSPLRLLFFIYLVSNPNDSSVTIRDYYCLDNDTNDYSVTLMNYFYLLGQ